MPAEARRAISEEIHYSPMGVIRGIECSLAYGENSERRCVWCGADLSARRKDCHWCGDECRDGFAENHYWTNARAAALHRDAFSCAQCIGLPALHKPRRREFGWDDRLYEYAVEQFRVEVKRRRLEVHHIVPLDGRGYAVGCVHHLSNLQTLCHVHHVGETRFDRKEAKREPITEQLDLVELTG